MLDFGLTQQDFRARFLERQVYVRTAAMAQRPLQWSDLDSLLHAIEPDESSLQLFNNGQIAAPAYVDETFELGRSRRRLNKHRFYALMQDGATLVLNRVESHSIPAKQLCAEVARFIGCSTTANAYVSFGGGGTFGKHWDTHDVFAIQLIGKKRWQVFQPTFPFPLSNHTSKQLQQECPATPVLDVVLSPGDLLYIPRGWWHQAIPFDEGSMHLSVGAYLPTLSDYIMWACSRHLPRHVTARHGVVDPATSLSEVTEVMRAISQTLASRETFEEFTKDLQARERLSNEFDTELFLSKPPGTLPDTARLALTSCYPTDTERGEVFINGGRMKLEPISRAIVRMLTESLALQLSDILAKLPQIPPHVIRTAITELVRYEVVTIIHETK